MPNQQSSKGPGGKKPTKSNAERRARKYGKYKARATCFVCKLVFHTPKQKVAHVASKHVSMVGQNPKQKV